MQTFFLKFDSEAQAIEALAEYRSTGQESLPYWLTASHSHALDVVGTIHKPTGVMLQGGIGECPEMAPIDGFHVNLMCDELPESLQPYALAPANPVRVFGGRHG